MKTIIAMIVASIVGVMVYVVILSSVFAVITAHAQTCGYAWHPPGAHDGYGLHEHGDAPPVWAVDAFTQCREGHTGYKGNLALGQNGVQSYFIAHIFSTIGARSHGDHDYQIWLKEPFNGPVSYWGISGFTNTSMLNFGVPTAPHDCSKSSNRPSMQEFNNTEAWYTGIEQSSMVPAGVAWLMNEPNVAFCPGVITGDGSSRNIGWIVVTENFATAPYAQYISPTLGSYAVYDPIKGHIFNFGRIADFAPGVMTVPN